MELRPQPTFGLGAVLAILSAAGSLFCTCGGHPFWGLVLGVLALPFGAMGLIGAAAPRVRGAFLSVAAVVLGLVGIVFAVIAIAFRVVLFPF